VTTTLRRTTTAVATGTATLSALLAGSGLLLLAAAAPASAQASPGAVTVSVTGPTSGAAGGSGTFTVGVRNAGGPPVTDLRLAPQLPDGVTVSSVSASDDWACVIGPVRCTLERRLPSGDAASPLQVELTYDGLVEGPQEIAFVAVQGSGGAARTDRGSTVVDVTPAPEPTPPPAAPPAPAASPAPAAAPAPAAPAAPAPATPAPAAPAVGTPAPAAPAAPAPAPADEADDVVTDLPADVPVAPAPAPADDQPLGTAAEDAPATLPFADPEPTDVAVVATSAGAGDGFWLPMPLVAALLALSLAPVVWWGVRERQAAQQR
jgi:uncharacterized repeat protein (TIGR01451 family)